MMLPTMAQVSSGTDNDRYGTFRSRGGAGNLSPKGLHSPHYPHHLKDDDNVHRHWLLLCLASTFVLAAFFWAYIQRDSAKTSLPQPIESPPEAIFREAAVYVSRSRRWQQLNYGSCDSRKADACVMYNDSLAVSGWSELWIRAVPRDSSYEAYRTSMFAAGYAEGAMTQQRIYEFFRSTYDSFFQGDKSVPRKLRGFFRRNLDWMRQQVRQHVTEESSVSRYWWTVGGLLAQFEGLAAGFQDFARTEQQLSELDLFLLNADGDLIDLVPAVNGTLKTKLYSQRSTMSYQEAVKSLRCSAVIRILEDRSDVLWAHATWDEYSAMNRMYKHYDIPIPTLNAEGSSSAPRQRRISFASSPGFLSSDDDWYLMDSQLAVMETTNGLYRDSLYSLILPDSLLSWVRSSVANILATSAMQWSTLYSSHNSGTYNNQWMVLDLSRFSPGHGFRNGGFVVLEQIPGRLEVADLTEVLNRQGYWASYNVPFFQIIYQLSGFADQYALSNFDSGWSHSEAPRAKIFRRDAPQVTNLADLKRLIRYNDWRSDPLCQGHASNGISARYDMESDADLWALEGGIDAKVTSLHMARNLECEAVNGPSYDQNPIFDWRQVPPHLQLPHHGQPARFNFTFVPMKPRSFGGNVQADKDAERRRNFRRI